ncbi:MAG: hypothetical protein PWQ95_414 [Thermococcaceae archaeon]|nr:hypothetical protein [Thermococcaceae archaeon]
MRILLELFNSLFFKNMASQALCKNFVSVRFIPIGWSARTGRRKPGCQDGGVGGTGCKAPTMNPALQPGSQKGALPRKRRKADPSGVRQARHLDQTPDGYWYFPLREVPPAVLLAQFRLILPETTAMGVRLSHASHGGVPLGHHRRTAQ